MQRSRLFPYTGFVVAFPVPSHVAGTLRITAAGACGGDWYPELSTTFRSSGGRGGTVRGYLDASTVPAGSVLQIAVGQIGGHGSPSSVSRPPGGASPTGRDGGAGGRRGSGSGGAQNVWSAGGGAGTEISVGGSPIMVAGAGGGGRMKSTGTSSQVGMAGGLGIADGAGYNGTTFFAPTGYGGTTSGAGAGGTTSGLPPGLGFNGSAGSGGSGGDAADYDPAHTTVSDGGSGGGGGYYGGGGGGTGTQNNGGYGGGGSSWCDVGAFDDVDDAGSNTTGDGYVLIEWDGTEWFAGRPITHQT